MADSTANLSEEVVFEKKLGRLANFYRVMRQIGLPHEAIQMPIDDAQLRMRLARAWLSGAYTPLLTESDAKNVMGENFVGRKEAQHAIGYEPDWQLEHLMQFIPVSRELLRECKDTHILVPGYPLSILDLQGVLESRFQKDIFAFPITDKKYPLPLYFDQPFARTKAGLRWFLVRKSVMLNSYDKNFDQQCEMLNQGEECPEAWELAYAMALYAAVKGIRLYEHDWAISKTIATRPDVGIRGHVTIGCGGAGSGIRLDIHEYGPHPRIGISDIRVF